MTKQRFTLPREYFSSEELFQQEIEKIFYTQWICVGRSAQLDENGDYFLVEVGDESIIVLRDHQGQVHAYYNVCRHRGTQLCQEANGRFKKSIQCPYHAWTYTLDGKLIGTAGMDVNDGFDKGEYPLFDAALHEWSGFLFINLSKEPSPFDETYAELGQRFAAWQVETLHSVQRIEYLVDANWKLIAENYNECYHCPLIHPALSRVMPADQGGTELDEGTVLGGYMILRDGHSGMSMSGQSTAPPIGSVGGEDLNRVHFYTIFPNLLLSLHPDYVMFHTLWPLSNGQTRVVCEWLFDPAAIAQPDFDASDAIEFWDTTNREDWHACEISQKGVRSRAYQPGPYYMWHEDLLAAFDDQVKKQLNGN